MMKAGAAVAASSSAGTLVGAAGNHFATTSPAQPHSQKTTAEDIGCADSKLSASPIRIFLG